MSSLIPTSLELDWDLTLHRLETSLEMASMKSSSARNTTIDSTMTVSDVIRTQMSIQAVAIVMKVLPSYGKVVHSLLIDSLISQKGTLLTSQHMH